MSNENTRHADHKIEPLFTDRWSPRSFTHEAMPLADLNAMFEAARWAPSSYNSQPWRFVYALKGGKGYDTMLSLLNPFNQSWAKEAAALVFVLSKKTMMVPTSPDPVPSRSHSFDAGAAWAQLALQGTKLGWMSHAMVGLDFDRAVAELHVPEGYAVEIAIAIGRRGPREALPEGMLRDREVQSGRTPISELVFEGVFKA